MDQECEKLAAKGDKEAFELCSDWTLCWEKAEAENGNFSFRPVELGEMLKTTVLN